MIHKLARNSRHCHKVVAAPPNDRPNHTKVTHVVYLVSSSIQAALHILHSSVMSIVSAASALRLARIPRLPRLPRSCCMKLAAAHFEGDYPGGLSHGLCIFLQAELADISAALVKPKPQYLLPMLMSSVCAYRRKLRTAQACSVTCQPNLESCTKQRTMISKLQRSCMTPVSDRKDTRQVGDVRQHHSQSGQQGPSVLTWHARWS